MLGLEHKRYKKRLMKDAWIEQNDQTQIRGDADKRLEKLLD